MGNPSYEGLHLRLFQDESNAPVARRVGIRDMTLVILCIIVVLFLMAESYERGAEDGYWEAIDEENIYSCEIMSV